MSDNTILRVLELVRCAEGGMKEHYIKLIKGLKDRGIEVVALCNFGQDEMRDLKNWGINVIPFYMGGEIQPIQDMVSIKRISGILKKHEVDVIHCHGFKAGFVGRLAAMMGGCPCIYTIHNFLPDSMSPVKKKGIKWLEKMLASSLHTTITVSRALRQHAIDMLNIPENRIHVIYNGIEIPDVEEKREDIRAKWGINTNEILVGTVARLIPSKGISFLLEAIPNIIKEYPNAKFMIVGKGPEERKLQEKAESLNCRENIIFTGYAEYIWYYYKAFDIFVLPTLSEGLGISILEAMAVGKPVIASKTGGIPEIIRHGSNGYLTPPGDSEKLAQAILYLISHPEERRRYGKKGWEEVKEQFNNHAMVEKTLDLINKALGR